MSGKVVLTLAAGFKANDDSGAPIVSGKAYELTKRLDELVRMGILIPEGEPEEEPEQEPEEEPEQPTTMEGWAEHFAAFSVPDLRTMAGKAELELDPKAKKAELVQALAENEMAILADEEKAAEWAELYGGMTDEELMARADELGVEIPEGTARESIVESLVDAEMEGAE